MSKRSDAKRRTVRRKRRGRSQSTQIGSRNQPPTDLASRLRGIYRRTARRLGVHPSYVSRVARSERRSRVIERALRRELAAIVRAFSEGKSAGKDRSAVRKRAKAG